MPLRERKRAMTRRGDLTAADVFEERGFDASRSLEIADAANVSVKMLFVDFRSKEDLAFADQAARPRAWMPSGGARRGPVPPRRSPGR